jgi:peptide-methionine (S)-S-oxide reductase
MTEFRALYPAEADFVASTAAARVNGYLGGYGSLEQLRSEREELGLSRILPDARPF